MADYLQELLSRNQEYSEEIVLSNNDSSDPNDDSAFSPQRKRKAGGRSESPSEPEIDEEATKRMKVDKMAADFIQATRTGSVEVMQSLVSAGADVNAKVCGCSAIFYAAFYGRNETINFLADMDAELDSTNLNGETALFWAVERGQYEAVELLLKRGAKVSAMDQRGYTALHKAAKMGSLPMVQLLVETGQADVNQISNSSELEGTSALQEAAYWGKEDVAQYLIENNAKVDLVNKQGRNALYKAVYRNHPNVVRILVENGADMDMPSDARQRSSLHWASFFGHLEVVKVLLENGADLDKKDKSKSTCDDIAKMKSHKEIAQFFAEWRKKMAQSTY